MEKNLSSRILKWRELKMKIWVVVDVDNAKAVKAFCGEDAEERASDYADVYYSKTGFDCRYDEVALLKTERND